jgi:hypothetical protein
MISSSFLKSRSLHRISFHKQVSSHEQRAITDLSKQSEQKRIRFARSQNTSQMLTNQQKGEIAYRNEMLFVVIHTFSRTVTA